MLKGKNILITGGTGMLGIQLVQDIIKYEGYPIITTTNIKKAEEKLSELGINASQICLIELDLKSELSIDNCVDSLNKNKIILNGIICNASYRNFNSDNRDKLSYYHDFLSVDTIGHLLLIEKIMTRVSFESLSIVMVSSIYATMGVDDKIYPDGMTGTPIEYAISKSSIKGMVKFLCVKYGSEQMRINSIISGGIENNQNQEFVKRYSEKTALKRMAKPEEISNSISFLISDLSSYITGTELVVDGGFSAF